MEVMGPIKTIKVMGSMGFLGIWDQMIYGIMGSMKSVNL